MDTILISPGSSPFEVAFAYDPDIDDYRYVVSEGRILIDFHLYTVEGISGVGDADIYLIADEGMTNIRLSTEEGEQFSKLIIQIKDSDVKWRDVTGLCIGYPEVKEPDIYLDSRSNEQEHTRVHACCENHRRGDQGSSGDTTSSGKDKRCDWCKRHDVDLKSLSSEVKELIKTLIPKLQQISEKKGIEISLPEIDF